MHPPRTPVLTLLAVATGVVLSALAGLVLAAPHAHAGADLVGRWLVGWATAALVLVPIAWSAVQGRRIRRAPSRAAAALSFRSRRLG